MKKTIENMTETIDNGVIHLGPPEGKSYNQEEKRDGEVNNNNNDGSVDDEVIYDEEAEEKYAVEDEGHEYKKIVNVKDKLAGRISKYSDVFNASIVLLITLILLIESVNFIKPKTEGIFEKFYLSITAVQ